MRLEGRWALVTGAAVRVGREIALELARAGANVHLHYHRSRAEAESTAEEIRGLGVEAVLVNADLERPSDLDELTAECAGADLLVNSASIFPRTPLETVDVDTFDEILAVNLRGPFFLARGLGLAMRERGRGVVVNVADWAGYRPHVGYLPYCVSKAGLIAATQGLAKALAPEVRVCAVAPGPVLFSEETTEAERRRILDKTPLGRAGTPADVAKAVRFLAEGSDFITGAVLTVDGGRLIA